MVVVTEARRRQLPEIEADTLSWLGTATTKQSKTSEARTYLQQARALYLQLQMTPQVGAINQKLKSLGHRSLAARCGYRPRDDGWDAPAGTPQQRTSACPPR